MSLMISPGVRGICGAPGGAPLTDAAAAGWSAGRGRGTVADVLSATAAGFVGASTLLNIGAGCEPDCMNSTLMRIATLAKATTRKPTASRGLQPSAWNRRESRSASTAALFPRPPPPLRLRTFPRLVVDRLLDAAWHQPLDRGLLAALNAGAIDRQVACDARALPDPAHDLELAAVQRQQALDDRQAETGAVVPAIVARARLEERIAHARHILGVDADAVVLHRDRDRAARSSLGAHHDLAAVIGELDRVGNQVEHDLAQRALVGDDQWQLSRDPHGELDPGLAGLQRQHVAGISDDMLWRERLGRDLEIAGLDLRHVQNTVHHRE